MAGKSLHGRTQLWRIIVIAALLISASFVLHLVYERSLGVNTGKARALAPRARSVSRQIDGLMMISSIGSV